MWTFPTKDVNILPVTISDKFTPHSNTAKLPWHDAGCHAALEGTCQEKTRRSWTKIQENVFAHGKIADAVQTNIEACVDQRHTAVGMHETEKQIIQRFQNKALRNTVVAPWYIRNADLHWDLQMEMVTNETGKFAKKHEERFLHHVNVKAIKLLDNSELVRRLKKKRKLLSWCSDH